MRMKLLLKGVNYALYFHFNLIFLHVFEDGDFDNHFAYGKWKLKKDKLATGKGIKFLCCNGQKL